MSLFGRFSPRRVKQLIDWLEREHPIIGSIEIKSLFGSSSVRIEMGRERPVKRVQLGKETQAETATPKEKAKIPSQKQDVAISELGNGAEDEKFFYMKFPWSDYKFRVSRTSFSLLVGNRLIECVLEPIVAQRNGTFFLGKTYNETGKKKRKLRSGDVVVTGDRLGIIVYKEKGKKLPSRESVLAKTIGHLDIPQGIDWASVKEGDTLMLIAVTKSEKTVPPET